MTLAGTFRTRERLVAGTFREGGGASCVERFVFLCVCGGGGYVQFGLLSIIQSLMCLLVRSRAVCSAIVCVSRTLCDHINNTVL